MVEMMRGVRDKLASDAALVAYGVMAAIACAVIASYYSTVEKVLHTACGFGILAGFFFLWSMVKSFTHESETFKPGTGTKLFELAFFSLLKIACAVGLMLFALPSVLLEGGLFWTAIASYLFWTACSGLATFVFGVTNIIKDHIEAIRWNRTLIREQRQRVEAQFEAKRQASAQAKVEDSLLSDLASYLSEDRDK